MKWIKSYNDYITEGKKGLTNAGSIMKTDNIKDVKVSVTYTDETLEPLRRKLYDEFIGDANNDSDTINKCVSTIVYCLDKKMRIDSDIIELIAKTTNRKNEDVNKVINDMINKHYGEFNHYGMKV